MITTASHLDAAYLSPLVPAWFSIALKATFALIGLGALAGIVFQLDGAWAVKIGALVACIFLTAAVPAPATPAKTPVAAMTTPAAMKAPVQPTVPVMAAAPAKAPVATVKPAGKPDSTGSVIGGSLLQILLTILTVAIPIVLTPLVLWLLKKLKITNLQIQQNIDGTVDQAVVHGLNYANEQAYKLRDNPIPGAEKLGMATDKTLAYLKDSGIVDKGASYIQDLIEAKLGQDRDVPATDTPAVEDKSGDESKDTQDAK